MSNFNDFISLVYSIEDKATLEDFLVGITTEKERKALAQRVEIVKRLVAGQPHASIASDLGVGVATVTRGSKELAQGKFKIIKDNKV